MSYIYLPSDYVDNCNVVYNGYIRSYTNNIHTEWVDIYVNQDYMLKYGSTNYSQNVVCDSANVYTSDIRYKLGFEDTIVTVFILALVFALFLLNLRGYDL